MPEKLDLGDVTIPRRLYDFLMGTGEIDGVSFNELHDGLPGKFWWRGLLQCAAATPPAAMTCPHCTALREALEPFAARVFPEFEKWGDDCFDWDNIAEPISLGELRRARATLKDTSHAE